MGIRLITTVISALMVVGSVLAIAINGINWGADFTGGIVVSTGNVRLDSASALLRFANGVGNDIIQFTESATTPTTVWTAGIPDNDPDGYMGVTVEGKGQRFIPFWI